VQGVLPPNIEDLLSLCMAKSFAVHEFILSEAIYYSVNHFFV
jgi:hypothetical protein